jgi:hypothetical protein
LKFDRSKKYFLELQKFEIKYDFEDLKKMNSFIHRSFFGFERDFESKFKEFPRFRI